VSDVVCNASPLIVLAKVDLLSLMPKLFGRTFVPEAVIAEIEAGPADDPMPKAIRQSAWLIPVQLQPPLSPLSTWALDRGEAEVIEYARLNGALPVMLDDRRARRVAERLGLKVHGTIGVVASAADRNLVPSFRESVSALRDAGLYVSDDIIDILGKQLGAK
jgi:predicted nucleic acid-binding protein